MWKKNEKAGVRSGGFLLMEVIVAMVVLSVGITAVMRAFFTITRLTRATGNSFYAVQRIENFLWEAEEDRSKFLAFPLSEENKTDERGDYQATVAVENATPEGGKDVRVSVTWLEPGRRENIEFQTFFYEPPPEEEEEYE